MGWRYKVLVFTIIVLQLCTFYSVFAEEEPIVPPLEGRKPLFTITDTQFQPSGNRPLTDPTNPGEYVVVDIILSQSNYWPNKGSLKVSTELEAPEILVWVGDTLNDPEMYNLKEVMFYLPLEEVDKIKIKVTGRVPKNWIEDGIDVATIEPYVQYSGEMPYYQEAQKVYTEITESAATEPTGGESLPEIHSGGGAVCDSETFNFGTGEIFYSSSDDESGYLYSSESRSDSTVYFGDVVPVAQCGEGGMGPSYEGVANMEDFTDSGNHIFDTRPSIAIGESGSSCYQGILLFRQNDMYGGIDPVLIDSDGCLHYNYWYDANGGSDFSSHNSNIPTPVPTFLPTTAPPLPLIRQPSTDNSDIESFRERIGIGTYLIAGLAFLLAYSRRGSLRRKVGVSVTEEKKGKTKGRRKPIFSPWCPECDKYKGKQAECPHCGASE